MKVIKSKLFNIVLIVICIIINIFFIKSILLLQGVENLLRLLIIIFVGIISMVLFIFLYRDNKLVRKIILQILLILYSLVLFVLSFNIVKIYSNLKNVSTAYSFHYSSLITMETNPINSISEIDDGKIGIFNDENNIEGYQIPLDVIEEKKLSNEIVYYDSYSILIEELLNSSVKYIFLPTNYQIMFDSLEGINETLEKTKIIYTAEKEIKKEIIQKNNALNEPITLLLMGVDSEKENISSGTFNGDALMVFTFNPKTLTSTILSIPRDSYVPIACFSNQRKNKITHAAWYGEDCMIKTIEGFLDIDIDYYVKINFKGLVKLVDSLGGIKVDVPYSFCEQDSNRKWGKNTVYVKEGEQLLTGEQALALARNRKNNTKKCGVEWGGNQVNDFVRGQNQQLVIKGIMDSLKGVNKVSVVHDILKEISHNMETNMHINEILSFYNVGKDILDKSKNKDDVLHFERLYISGYSKMIMDYSAINNQGMRSILYNFIPYKGSINDVVKAMKVNLELEPVKIIKTLKFDINEPYKEVIIGKGFYNEASLSLLPNFIGSKESDVRRYANKYNFKLNVNYVDSSDSNTQVGMVVSQKPYAQMDINYVKDITIDVVKTLKIEKEEVDNDVNCSLEENKDHSTCLLPNFVGQKYSDYKNWFAKQNLSIIFEEVEIKIGDVLYDVSKHGEVIFQSVESGTSIYDLIDCTFQIKYIGEEINEDDKDDKNLDEEITNDDEELDITELVPLD